MQTNWMVGTKWIWCVVTCAILCCGSLATAQDSDKKFGSAKAGRKARNQGTPPAEVAADPTAGAPGNGGGFDLATFSQNMFQQFDADGNGGLDQQELQNCLAALHQQVEQQNQAIAAAAREQAFMEMGAGGQGGKGFAAGGGAGGQGGGFNSANGQANSDQQSSSAFAEFSASSVNGRGQMRGQQGSTGGGRSGGGGGFGGGAMGGRGGNGGSGGGGGRGGR